MRAFDEPASLRINVARGDFLEGLLRRLNGGSAPRRAADVGCGYGWFAGKLLEHGLDVTAIDGRAENVAEAARRHPALKTAVHDIEGSELPLLGTFDFVLCYGLLYHLENPFAAIRNLVGITGDVLLLESVCAPGAGVVTVMYEEEQDIDQALNYVAMIPTESWLVKALYVAGIEHVYRTSEPPNHPDFRSRMMKRRRRTVLVAARRPLSIPSLDRAAEPATRKHMWDPFGPLLESDRVRAALRRRMQLRADDVS